MSGIFLLLSLVAAVLWLPFAGLLIYRSIKDMTDDQLLAALFGLVIASAVLLTLSQVVR